MKFRVWLEAYKDIFGFEEDEVAEKVRLLRRADDRPIKPFDITQMLEDMATQRVGRHHGFQRFSNEVQWGTGPGAVKVEVGTQMTAYIERAINDLAGNLTWVTKKVYKINAEEYRDYPDAVADALMTDVNQVFGEGLDGPDRHYSHDALIDLVEHLVQRIKETRHQYFVYEGVKRVNEHNYIIRFSAKGGGVGALFTTHNQGRINEFLIDVSFNPEAGLLHAILTSVQTGDEGASWEIQPSLFEGWYAPTQAAKDITESLLTSMKYF